ncbi:MAG: tRNA (adenosine(37)-N6)-dimethylallyltransferase MiaA [Pseudoflavonifractor sp.]|nr:tRNA (adenosine(37)-N6)-dimethylallyltransferase MiaA [Alloprevotella sp.]MCM1116570.1 tRNA (adenosine(37)-N6)-dimethylallyltransferase MiaA [Pseudoflavonifractor sp.]
MRPRLIVVTGPTASGKSTLAVDLASEIGCEIISADSRQVYRGIEIATAAPSREQLSAVCHHLVGHLPLEAYYSASRWAEDAEALLPGAFERGHGWAVVCGGSMMYIDALTEGLDDLPTVSGRVRGEVWKLYESGGIDALRAELRILDPEYLSRVDLSNPRRLMHAIEISLMAGRPYSSLIGRAKARDLPYDIVRLAINWPREELFNRISRRVDAMMGEGLVDEVRGLMARRGLNSLNTVGVKEIMAYLDGEMTEEEAMAKIARNTRVYAKKQLTWMRRYGTGLINLDPHQSLLWQALEAVR